MKIIFMGTPEFAIPSLQILLDNSYDVQAVVTVPDKPQGRGRKLLPAPVKKFAMEKNLKILQPEKLDDMNFLQELKRLTPDIIVVVAFRILPEAVYMLPKYGSFNLHPSLLPKYRGPAPINWAIINGEKETGVTTFFLQEKVDSGGIILQKKIEIGIDDTAGELQKKLSYLGAQAVLESVRLIESGNVVVVPQDEMNACYAPKIFKDGCRIDWKKSAYDIHNFVRGLSPEPTAWTTHKGKILKIYRTKFIEAGSAGNPGAIFHKSKNLLEVNTGNGILSILEIQQEGRRRLGIEEFLRGYKMEEGEILC